MAKIVDPDQLNQATEVTINTGTLTITLNIAGNLDDNSPGRTSGVTMQALYSFLKEEWLSDSALNKFRFPIKAFTKFEFQWINGWAPGNAQTRDLLRDAGWIEGAGAQAGDQYAGIISLGSFDAVGDQAYYQNVTGFNQTVTNFDKTGEVNEAILIFDADGADTTGFLKVYLREQAKLYAVTNLLVDQDLALLEPTVYRLPLANAPDIKVTESDANIDANTPYTGMQLDFIKGIGFTTWAVTTAYAAESVVQDSGGRWWFTLAGGTSAGNDSNLGGGSDTGVTWEAFAGERQIGTNYYAFNRIVDGNSATAEEIYEWSQRQLRKTSNINADTLGTPNQDGFGTVNGNVAVQLLSFQGDTLQTNPGVYIDLFNVNDQNRIEFFDITVDGGGVDSESVPVTSTARTFPFVAAGNLLFSQNLDTEPNADTLYRMYFTYTRTQTGTDFATSASSGSNTTFTTTTTNVSTVTNGSYFTISGMTNAANNGLWQATTAWTSTGGNATKQDGATVVDETAGATVTIRENPFNSPGAIVVDDNSTTDITGQITAASIAFDFDYDNNVQGGRTAATDAPVTVVAQGLAGAEWVEAAFTITRATGLQFAVNANDERNYSNPV